MSVPAGVPASFADLPLTDPAGPADPADPAARTLEEVGREPWLSPEGIPVRPVYTADDLEDLRQSGALDNWPGFPPYLRGPYPTMYTTQPWTVRQYAGF